MGVFQLRAAEYMRMSTEHQQYSIANQSAAIQDYANTHSIEIVRTFVDRGKSGLHLAGRPGLKDLLHTVESGTADFSVLLVYDVSRWGRFQDVDESAYYEFGLKKAGISVIYCAEPFREGGPLNALLKTLKRTMAAEYSRELSVKVSAGQRRIAALGYRVCGLPGFGLRRMVFDPAGSRRIVLANGERKSIQTDRITLVHGPAEEVRVVRKVFDLFASGVLTESGIARYLTRLGVVTQSGCPWSKTAIRRMLLNPKYVGDMVFSRTTARMASAPADNPPDQWVSVADQFEPIVSREVFNRVKEIFERRVEDPRPDEMLSRLRSLLLKHGRLSGPLIDAEEGMLTAATYRRRFGSLMEAYRRIGWAEGETHDRYVVRVFRLRLVQIELERAIAAKLSQVAGTFSKQPRMPLWNVDGEISIFAKAVCPRRPQHMKRVWTLYPGKGCTADLVILARFDERVDRIIDYFVFGGSFTTPILVPEETSRALEMHRFEDLSFLETTCRRVKAEGVPDEGSKS